MSKTYISDLWLNDEVNGKIVSVSLLVVSALFQEIKDCGNDCLTLDMQIPDNLVNAVKQAHLTDRNKTLKYRNTRGDWVTTALTEKA